MPERSHGSVEEILMSNGSRSSWFIYNAIAPAEVDQVIFTQKIINVPSGRSDNKLSLYIGRRGQNVRLAAHLTGYRIDIKSASEFEEI